MHILIREAAYHGLLKRTRADLHVRFIDWLERVAPDRVLEFEEIVAITSSRPSSRSSSSRRTTRRSGRSASAGAATSPPPAGVRSRGATSRRPRTCCDGPSTLLPPGHPERPRLRLDAAEALTEQGGFDEGERDARRRRSRKRTSSPTACWRPPRDPGARAPLHDRSGGGRPTKSSARSRNSSPSSRPSRRTTDSPAHGG